MHSEGCFWQRFRRTGNHVGGLIQELSAKNEFYGSRSARSVM
jgi:hypothetical protein